MISVAPPGGNGIIILIGRLGHVVCANSSGGPAKEAAAAVMRTSSWRREIEFIGKPSVLRMGEFRSIVPRNGRNNTHARAIAAGAQAKARFVGANPVTGGAGRIGGHTPSLAGRAVFSGLQRLEWSRPSLVVRAVLTAKPCA